MLSLLGSQNNSWHQEALQGAGRYNVSHSVGTGACSLPGEKKVNFHFTSWGCIYWV